MKNIFATSVWLYVGDALFVAFLLVGSFEAAGAVARRSTRRLVSTITWRQMRRFMLFQIAWLTAGLVLFKFIILQGGPGFTHLVATGNHGSVQFSTIGELAAAIATLYGFTRWLKWMTAHTLYVDSRPATTSSHTLTPQTDQDIHNRAWMQALRLTAALDAFADRNPE